MSERPPVTIVMASYRRKAVLPATLATLLGQRGVDVRVIIVDDHSDDGTWEYLQALEHPQVQVIRSPGRADVAVARNAAIALVDTPYLAFCDDDDLWAPTKLAAQLDAIAATPDARWSCVGAVTVDKDDHVIGYQRLADSADLLPRLLHADTIPGGASGVLVARSLVEEVGAFALDLETQHDWDLWIRFALASPIASVDEPLVAYRVWPGAMSWDVGPMDRDYQEIISRYAGAPDPSARTLFDQYLARMELRNGDRRGAARRHLRMAGRDRLPKQLGHAALALLAPNTAEARQARRELAQVPPHWRTQAEQWLGDLPAPVTAADDAEVDADR